MTQTRQFQTNFTAGWIDEALYGRIDVEQYERGAAEILNYRILPQGGLQRREGLAYVGTAATPAQSEKARLFGFEFSTTQAYLCVLSEVKLELYDAVNRVVDIEFDWSVGTAPYTGSQLQELRWTQSADTLILCHQDVEPQVLRRYTGIGDDRFDYDGTTITCRIGYHYLQDGDFVVFSGVEAINTVDINGNTYVVANVTDTQFEITEASLPGGSGTDVGGALVKMWSFGPVGLVSVPRIDFQDDLSPTATLDTIQELDFVDDADAPWVNGDEFQVILNGVKSQKVKYTSDDTTLGQRIAEVLNESIYTPVTAATARTNNTLGIRARPGFGRYRGGFADSAGLSVGDGNITVSALGTPNAGAVATIRITLGGDNGGQDWSLFGIEIRKGLGLISVTKTQAGDDRSEPAWSDTRGWPRAVTFHDNRLWFGGSTSLPTSIWASRLGLYSDFNIGDGLDDDAISSALDASTFNGVMHIVSGRHLQVFTESAEYVCLEDPITPETFSLQVQSMHGCTAVRPSLLDGTTMFVQANGRGMRQLEYTITEEAYQAFEISLLARSLFNSPVDMAVQLHPSDGDYLYVVMGDGTCAVLNMHRHQNIAGWTQYATDSYFSPGYDLIESVAVVNDEVWFIIKRAHADARRLEVLDADYYADSASNATQSPPSGVLDSIPSQLKYSNALIDIVSDDGVGYTNQPYLLGDDVVSLSRVIGSTHTVGDYQAGFPIPTRIKSLFPFNSFQGGPDISLPRRISKATLMVAASKGLKVNGVGLYDPVQDAQDPYGGTEPTELSGVFETRLLGWSTRPQVTITQSGPFPAKILALEYEIASGRGGLGRGGSSR